MSSSVSLSNIHYNRDGPPRHFNVDDFQYTPLGKFIIYRLRHNYDAKLLITGSVGDGKTALGVDLARWVRKIANGIFDELYAWDVDEHAGLDVWKYLQAYKRSNPGDALVIDELQEAADKRRAMAKEAVFLSWAWMKLRVRQVVSVGILPTASVLDGRLEELADVWIHVTRRGHALPYFLHTNPFPPYKTYRIPFRLGDYRQSIQWPDLAGDPDYERLHEMKEDTGVPGIDDTDHLTESDLEEALRDFKKGSVQRALDYIENGGIDSQTKLAQVLEIDQSTVSKYKQELNAVA